MTDTTCNVSEETLVAFVAGDLPDTEEFETAVHLGECRACCDQAAEYLSLKRAIADCCDVNPVRWNEFETAAGNVRAVWDCDRLTRLAWADPARDPEEELGALYPDRPILRDPDALQSAEQQVRQYLSGSRQAFDLPLDLSECTSSFQRDVLEAARSIPYGSAVSYAELARRIGRPKASRAVGNALGRNPLPIVVPCHRIIRADGTPGGYVGGAERKRRLLELEAETLRVA